MRVVVPATPDGLHPAVVPAILRSGYDPQVVNVAASGEAYWGLLCALWEAGEAFCIVEHDIEVGPGQLVGLDRCPEPWCAYSYWLYWGDLADSYGHAGGLGCARFSAELIAAHRDLMLVDVANSTAYPNFPARHFMGLDATIAQWLRGPYRTPCHQHHPNVKHHHAYDYEGAYVPDEIRAKLPEGHPLSIRSL